MKRLIRFVLFVLYDYYKEIKGDEDAPYDGGILLLLIILYLNIIVIFQIFHILSMLPGMQSGSTVEHILLFTLCYYLPGYLIIRWLFPEKEIKGLTYSDDKVKRGRIFYLVYIIISTIASIASIVLF